MITKFCSLLTYMLSLHLKGQSVWQFSLAQSHSPLTTEFASVDLCMHAICTSFQAIGYVIYVYDTPY